MVVAAQHHQAQPAGSRAALLRPALAQAAAVARELELPPAQALALFAQVLNEEGVS
jgi:GntR family transcriptional regulator